MAFLKKGIEKRELQTDVKTNEDWEKLMQTQGLVVVDAYPGWCGPCKAITNIFRKIKNETGDDLLNLAVAQTDEIDFLEKYRGRSEPTFLFYGGGELVNVIRGCNGPLINKSVLSFLHKEHLIIKEEADREIFIDKFILSDEDEKEDPEKVAEDEEVARKMSMRIGKLPEPAKENEVKSSRSSTEVEEVQIPKKFAVALIKPDAVQAGLVDQIIEEIKANGLEILRQEEKTLSKEEAAEFYKQHEGSDHFEQLVEFMSSGPCMTLVVSRPGDDVGDDLLPEFRKLIGPLDVNTAKEEAPESLRAKYGTDSIQNAVHSCDTNESAARELAFFYPDFNVPMVERKQKKTRLQRTLALIRPNALQKRRVSILKAIEDSGFLIAMQKEVQLERAQVEDLYAEHKDKDYFESLITNMTCGPSLALCLAREDAVQVWRDMLGPKDMKTPQDGDEDVTASSGEGEQQTGQQQTGEQAETEGQQAEEPHGEQPQTEEPPSLEKETSKVSLRKKFSDPEDSINPLHGADTEEQAQREMNIFFPMETTVAVIKPDAYEKENERELIFGKIKEAGFKISSQKEVTLTKELASMFYKEHEGKDFFNNLTDYMSSGPTQFLILSREDAVSGFRSLLGPTAPEEAKEVNPNSLRAQFGSDPMKNAIHGSSSVSKAIDVINNFFPDVKLDENGRVIEAETADKANKDEGEVNANEAKEVSNGHVTTEEKTEETPGETLKEENGEAVKEAAEEPAAETAEGEVKPEEGATSEAAAAETSEEPAAAPEDVKVTEDAAKEGEAQPAAEETKEETPKEGGEAPTEDAEKKDTPSTVWDPASGGEVATVESHVEVVKPAEAPATTGEASTPPPVAEVNPTDTPVESETSKEAVTAPPAESAVETSEPVTTGEASTPPPVAEANPTDTPVESETSKEAETAPSAEPAATETPTADESNTETSREPTVVETSSEAAEKAETTETETSREPTVVETSSEKAETTETETSREPTMTTADETSATETSREPTVVETTTENETSREPTIEQSATEDSKTDTDATAS